MAGVRATRDPLERLKRYCLETELVAPAELKEIEVEAKREVLAAVEAAKAAPQPVQEELYNGIYTDQSDAFFIRGANLDNGVGIYGATK